jgi:hypothetical protein
MDCQISVVAFLCAPIAYSTRLTKDQKRQPAPRSTNGPIHNISSEMHFVWKLTSKATKQEKFPDKVSLKFSTRLVNCVLLIVFWQRVRPFFYVFWSVPHSGIGRSKDWTTTQSLISVDWKSNYKLASLMRWATVSALAAHNLSSSWPAVIKSGALRISIGTNGAAIIILTGWRKEHWTVNFYI